MITLIWMCQCELELAISTLETKSGGDLRHLGSVAGQLVGVAITNINTQRDSFNEGSCVCSACSLGENMFIFSNNLLGTGTNYGPHDNT
jgi:hypothetical protein